MKYFWIALIPLSAAFAQYAPGSSPRTYTQGNVLYPGGVPPQQPANAPLLAMGGYGQQRSGGHGGQGANGSGVRGNAPHPSHGRSVIVPLYFGTGYGYAEPYAEQSAPPPEPPIVIINQDYRPQLLNPVVHDYTNAQLLESPPIEQRQSAPPPASIQGAPADQSPTIFLIALNDGTIVAALGYWMEGDTLNYTTRDGNRNRISIDRVDRAFSVKLNADRNIEFKLE